MDNTNLPSKRSEAKASGFTKYFTGKPCTRGHVSHRYTDGGNCAACVAVRCAGYGKAVVDPEKRKQTLKKWNQSPKAFAMKLRWKEQNPKWAWAVGVVGGARMRACRDGVPHNIDKKYVYSITPDVCPVFGTPFVFLGAKRVGPNSPTLDKLDPAKGYVEGNIAVISMRANAIKSNATLEQIQAVADWLRSVTTATRTQNVG